MKNVALQIFALVSVALLSLQGLADDGMVGKPLPMTTIEKKGELLIDEKKKFYYSPWSTQSLEGKVSVFQYIGANLKSNKLNQHFQDAYDVAAVHYPLDKHQIITVLNLKDAMWGTGGFVTSELKTNKKKYPSSRIVVDQKGAMQQKLNLKKDSYAIGVMDRNGDVLFFKDGKLSEQEVEQVLMIVSQKL